LATGRAEQRRDPQYWLRLIWRRKRLLLAIALVIPAAVYGISSLLPKTYEATTTLQVRATSVSSTVLSNQLTLGTASAGDAVRIIQTTLVAKLAAQVLERRGEPVGDPSSLLGKIEARLDSEDESGFVTITARADDPEYAADIANAFADAVAARRADEAVKSINRTISTLEVDADQIAAEGGVEAREALALQLQELRALRASQQDTTTVIEPARPPGGASSPKPVRNTALALVVSLLLAGGMVPFLEQLDRRLRESDEFEELAGAPLLGMVPENAFPGNVPSPHVREAFQTLRAGLTYFNVDRSLASILVASPTHRDGKTTVATLLAVALAQDNRDVILLDADLRRHQAAKRLGVETGTGVEDVLLEEGKLEDALVDVDVEGGRLRVLPAVSQPPNPSVLLGSARMRSLLSELSERSDIVLIDTPPLLAVSDVIPLLEQVSGVVLVARMDYTTRDAVRRAGQVISTARGEVLGVVATGARGGGLYGYEGYGYGYGYGYVDETDRAQARSGNGADGRGPLGRVLGWTRSAKKSEQPLSGYEAFKGDAQTEGEADRPASAHPGHRLSELTFDPEGGAPASSEPSTTSEGERAEASPDSDKVSLNSATLEELRALGMSVTQAKRVLDYRERSGFSSVDELDSVPGFPRKLTSEIKPRLSV
jgi:capsular exopolysaccharide synthesis family protein